MKKTFSLLMGASLLTVGTAFGIGAPAQAFTLTFDSNAPNNSTNNSGTGASATLDFNFSDILDGVKLELIVTNTTNSTPGATDSELVAFGFDVASGFDVGDQPGTYFDQQGFEFVDSGDLNPFNGTFDIGYSINGGLDAPGNPNGGIDPGSSKTFTFNFATSDSAINVEALFKAILANDDGFSSNNDLKASRSVVRFKDVNAGAGSDKVGGITTPDNGGDPDPEPVPEPAAMAGLMAVGAGIVLNRRKKAQKA